MLREFLLPILYHDRVWVYVKYIHWDDYEYLFFHSINVMYYIY